MIEVLLAGLEALKEYIALHVLTCLIPAFLLAGGIVTFVSRETIIGYLGAAAGSFLPLVLPREVASLLQPVPVPSSPCRAASTMVVPGSVLPLFYFGLPWGQAEVSSGN